MVKKIHILLFTLLFGIVKSQNCQNLLVNDSLFKPSENKKIAVKAMTCNLKNGGKIQLINNNGKFILKLVLKEKLGFIETGNLEIKSGTKSFFVKNATLYNIKEEDACFLVDVMINYIGTIKEDGITSVAFNTKFETKFTKEDVSQIKKTGKCFYELHKK